MLTTDVGLVPAHHYSMPDLADLLNRTFAGYLIELRESSADLARRVATESVDLRASFVARVEGERALGLCLVGRRAQTNRVAAMGVVPSARRQGCGRQLMRRAVDDARAAGARRVLLEVLEHNIPARRLYESMGFQTRRRLVGFELNETSRPRPKVDPGLHRELTEVGHLDVARAVEREGPADPPWQMAAASIAELGPPCRAFTLGGHAWVLLRETPEGVLSMRGLTLARAHRGQGLGRRFMDALRARFPGRRWRVAPRIPEGHADGFFLALGFERMDLAQHEMELPLV